MTPVSPVGGEVDVAREDWAADHLRALAKALLPGEALADTECHATVIIDGFEEPCNRPAFAWTIYDPDGEQRAWPVCYLHADHYTRADSWVEAVSALPWLLARLEAAESARDEALAVVEGVRALADECASSGCIHLNDLWGRLRVALTPSAPTEESQA